MDFNIYIIFLILVIGILAYFLYKSYNKRNHLSVLSDAKVPITIGTSSLPTPNDSANFTYSIWIYIQDWNYNSTQKKPIIKRTSTAQEKTINFPYIYLDENINDLVVEVGESGDFKCRVSNIPLQRWTLVTVSVFQKVVDVYIDGKLLKTCVMNTPVSSSNSSDILITSDGGFSGNTVGLQYIPNAVDPQTVWDIYRNGNGVSGYGNNATKSKMGISIAVTDDGKVTDQYKLF